MSCRDVVVFVHVDIASLYDYFIMRLCCSNNEYQFGPTQVREFLCSMADDDNDDDGHAVIHNPFGYPKPPFPIGFPPAHLFGLAGWQVIFILMRGQLALFVHFGFSSGVALPSVWTDAVKVTLLYKYSMRVLHSTISIHIQANQLCGITATAFKFAGKF